MVPRFVFTVCQLGSEAALKREVARLHPDWRFSFSRPGFVTFRVADDRERALASLDSTFARAWGYSLGKLERDESTAPEIAFWSALRERLGAAAQHAAHLHVWPRDAAVPGDLGFIPGANAEATAAGERIAASRTAGERTATSRGDGDERAPLLRVNMPAAVGDTVLDCVLVEPGEWWLGWHTAARPETRWPGGVPPIAAPPDMISRAYLKVAEALLWSELPLEPGDRCVEIGSAPGGATQALLERGCIVTGIDPAEMDSRVLAHPRFTHVRARAKDLRRSAYGEFRWLCCDANVAPNYTLDTVEAIVTDARTRIAGLLLTLKLTKPSLVALLPDYCERVRSWGYTDVRARQLAFNRAEVCVAARRDAP